MFRRMSFVLAVVATLLLGAGVARADDPYRVVLSRVDPSDFPTVRLVASVVDASGKAVPGLRPQDLQVREGTIAPQANVTLASMVSPVALALVIDTSGSMAGQPLADAKAAVGSMVGSLGAIDQVAIRLGHGVGRGTVAALSGAVRGGATYLAPSSSDLAAIYGRLSEQLLTEYSVEYRSAATDLPAGSIVPFEITVGRAGAILARATGTFTVPAGGGQARSPVPTTAPALPADAAAPLPVRPQNSWIVGLLGAMTSLVLVLWLNELTLHM